MLSPVETEVDEPMGVNATCHLPQHFVAEAPEHEVGHFPFFIESVAVCEIENFTADVEGAGLFVYCYAAFLLQIVLHPHVMVACEVMHLNSHVGEFADFT